VHVYQVNNNNNNNNNSAVLQNVTVRQKKTQKQPKMLRTALNGEVRPSCGAPSSTSFSQRQMDGDIPYDVKADPSDPDHASDPAQVLLYFLTGPPSPLSRTVGNQGATMRESMIIIHDASDPIPSDSDLTSMRAWIIALRSTKRGRLKIPPIVSKTPIRM